MKRRRKKEGKFEEEEGRSGRRNRKWRSRKKIRKEDEYIRGRWRRIRRDE